jgi:hypothetical protein
MGGLGTKTESGRSLTLEAQVVPFCQSGNNIRSTGTADDRLFLTDERFSHRIKSPPPKPLQNDIIQKVQPDIFSAKESQMDGQKSLLVWHAIKSLTLADRKEVEELICLLWPEIGVKCAIMKECGTGFLYLIQATTGFWVVEMCLERAGLIATSWAETERIIEKKSLLEGVTMTSPKEEDNKNAAEQECMHNQRPLTKIEKTEFDAVLLMFKETCLRV